ncbi:hypothetical protein L208DRAFT_149336 [Tricholoma matsutake]|nr:hypothetical protein L208DRAFT_149336 [Tricholoma matsutake 945]
MEFQEAVLQLQSAFASFSTTSAQSHSRLETDTANRCPSTSNRRCFSSHQQSGDWSATYFARACSRIIFPSVFSICQPCRFDCCSFPRRQSSIAFFDIKYRNDGWTSDPKSTAYHRGRLLAFSTTHSDKPIFYRMYSGKRRCPPYS